MPFQIFILFFFNLLSDVVIPSIPSPRLLTSPRYQRYLADACPTSQMSGHIVSSHLVPFILTCSKRMVKYIAAEMLSLLYPLSPVTIQKALFFFYQSVCLMPKMKDLNLLHLFTDLSHCLQHQLITSHIFFHWFILKLMFIFKIKHSYVQKNMMNHIKLL